VGTVVPQSKALAQLILSVLPAGYKSEQNLYGTRSSKSSMICGRGLEYDAAQHDRHVQTMPQNRTMGE